MKHDFENVDIGQASTGHGNQSQSRCRSSNPKTPRSSPHANREHDDCNGSYCRNPWPEISNCQSRRQLRRILRSKWPNHIHRHRKAKDRYQSQCQSAPHAGPGCASLAKQAFLFDGIHTRKEFVRFFHGYQIGALRQDLTAAVACSVTSSYPCATMLAALWRYIAGSRGAQVPSPST